MSLRAVSKKTNPKEVQVTLSQAQTALLSDQTAEGYWWYSLEANESIGAGFIQLMHFLGEVDSTIQAGLVKRILSEQRPDGSWALFYEGPPDLSITIECYLALRLAGQMPDEEPLKRARQIILELGGLESARVFTKIHLSLFGLESWEKCPTIPSWFIHFPVQLGVSIYEFSSWARASIVPLMILFEKKPVVSLPFRLDELRSPKAHATHSSRNDLTQRFFLLLDSGLKILEKLPWYPGKENSLKACEKWIREHIARTEDIYPAMAYGALAIKALGYPNSDPTIQKALSGLERFQQSEENIHQQCCISPLWDSPWAATALLESGLEPDHPALKKGARYLISHQILDFRGDWSQKSPDLEPGGWAFEFQNDYFPDVDDTIQILRVLQEVDLPSSEKEKSIDRGLNWLLGMQSKNGGWAAFDKDQSAEWVNWIPFSDHDACLDSPTPDITGRAIEVLSLFGYSRENPEVRRAIAFLKKSQEPFGAWRGRWGVNFIYGTWCVLQGFAAIEDDLRSQEIRKAVDWLKSIQNNDGGWGESCLSDEKDAYVPLGHSLPSQTAWAVLGLIAAGERDSIACQRGIQFLVRSQNSEGRWEERHHTGTGFPGHFYIRYHGYRQYFPLLALGKYCRGDITDS